jgi:anti-anti-sigma factor
VLSLTLIATVLGPDGGRALATTVQEACKHETPPTTIRVHLDHVKLMTSAAIGTIIVLHKQLASNNQQLELVGLTPAVFDAFEFLKLDRMLSISTAG